MQPPGPRLCVAPMATERGQGKPNPAGFAGLRCGGWENTGGDNLGPGVGAAHASPYGNRDEAGRGAPCN
jgi:hypothetical protein